MKTFSTLLAICAGNSPVTGEFPAQRAVTRSFDVFFDLHLNKRFSKQSWGWRFETPSRILWRHCDVWIFYFGIGGVFFREHKFHLDVNLKHSVKCLLTREWHELFTTNFCVHPDGSVVRHSHKLVGIWFLNLTSRKKKLFSTRGEFFVELVPIARQMHGTYDGRLYY